MGKKVTRKVVKNKKAKIVTDQKGDDHFVVLEEETTYTFTNLRNGKFFFKRSDGKDDVFEGKQTKDDITAKERTMFLKTLDFQNGWLVEESDKPLDDNELFNRNSLSDSKVDELIKKNGNDIEKLRKYVESMDSQFAVGRFKSAFLKHDLPSSLLAYCDFKLKQLEEIELEKHKAPVDKTPEGV